MRKKEIEAKLDKLAKDGLLLWEHAFRPTPDTASATEVANLRKEITKLRDLLDEVIEPGYVLSKKADRGLYQKGYQYRTVGGDLPYSYNFLASPYTNLLGFWGDRWRGLAKGESNRPTSGSYEIRRRISNELIATFANRDDADVFIETLDGPCVDETGEEASE